ncbi:MAG: carbohydrate ABC transporter permease [Propionicimonas sp.]|uniref:carbohydrate ABC transporter permease n=1 Tax=Propionicimonas sp. TaxID=1955623 RepID=UPI002B20BD28|nr:carbohydrate ABC transporter permease [Propionicimonas sp.]MEA4944309.1 carbohydrate ABC transporter permease [Propionicimonas sp.]MEA5054637.1 carbohydrate ABC transporter permease [Propionicimonas sp.]MEA5116816.1 carbohydrate ABC transporter permease [Propionicimonas sp.]
MKRRQWIRLWQYVAAVVACVAILAPFGWMVIASFQTQAELVRRPLPWWPQEFYPDRYLAIFTDRSGEDFRAALLNSLVVATCVVVVSMLVGVLGSYAFARLRFRFRRAILMTFLFTYMLPQIALLIPLYMILSGMNLLDSVWGLVLVDCSLVVPFVLWILSNYFITIPLELEESAWIDGASRFGALWRIVLPSARPGLFAAGMFAFLLAWDEFMYALIFTSSNASKTVPVAIAEFSGRYSTDFGLVAAGGVLAALPPVLLAVVFQRYVVSGLVSGSVKA